MSKKKPSKWQITKNILSGTVKVFEIGIKALDEGAKSLNEEASKINDLMDEKIRKIYLEKIIEERMGFKSKRVDILLKKLNTDSNLSLEEITKLERELCYSKSKIKKVLKECNLIAIDATREEMRISTNEDLNKKLYYLEQDLAEEVYEDCKKEIIKEISKVKRFI